MHAHREMEKGRLAAILPTVFMVAAFLVPIAGLLRLSLQPTDSMNNPLAGVTLHHYEQVLGTQYLRNSVVSSLSLAVRVSLASIVLAYPVAWYLARGESRGGKTVVMAVVLSPLLTSEVVRSLGWRILMSGEGPVNNFLQWAGLTHAQLPLLTSPWVVFLAVLHVLLPFAILPLVTSLRGIDGHLIQASGNLGASSARTFWSVVLPLSMRGVGAGLSIVFSLCMGIYVTPLMVGGGNQSLAGLKIQNEALVSFDQATAAALSFVLLVSTLISCSIIAFVTRRWGRVAHA